jgi:hypothetical protein
MSRDLLLPTSNCGGASNIILKWYMLHDILVKNQEWSEAWLHNRETYRAHSKEAMKSINDIWYLVCSTLYTRIINATIHLSSLHKRSREGGGGLTAELYGLVDKCYVGRWDTHHLVICLVGLGNPRLEHAPLLSASLSYTFPWCLPVLRLSLQSFDRGKLGKC